MQHMRRAMIMCLFLCGIFKAINPQVDGTVVQEWDKRHFSKLTQDQQILVVAVLHSTCQYLDKMAEDDCRTAKVFLGAYTEFVQFYSQITTLLLPSEEDKIGCLTLPCSKSYRSSMGVYQENLSLIEALDIVPSINNVWGHVMDVSSDKYLKTAENIERAVCKALRNKKARAKIVDTLQQDSADMNAYIIYIKDNYSDLMLFIEEQEKALRK